MVFHLTYFMTVIILSWSVNSTLARIYIPNNFTRLYRYICIYSTMYRTNVNGLLGDDGICCECVGGHTLVDVTSFVGA